MKKAFYFLEEIHLVVLISSAAVIRKEKHLKSLLKVSMEKKTPHEKIYEALLQTYLIAGIPSALNSMRIASDFIKIPEKKNHPQNFKEMGIFNCRQIYGNNYEKLIQNINSFSPELADWIIEDCYGKTLGRLGLSLKERELCIISNLSAMGFGYQLYSHINGAFRMNLPLSDIETVIKNLSLIGSKAGSDFGLKIFNEYKLKKGI